MCLISRSIRSWAPRSPTTAMLENGSGSIFDRVSVPLARPVANCYPRKRRPWTPTFAGVTALWLQRRSGMTAYANAGSPFSTSILYCLIARVTSFGVIFPALASAQMAAWAM